MANGAVRYTPPNPEERRPGITPIIEELLEKNPSWSHDLAVAHAKAEWHKRNPSRTITREQLLAMYPPPAPPSPDELAALERLLAIAQSDTGQSRRVADFLLAWWNADSCGGFDLTNLWAVDTAIARDIVAVFALVARVHSWPSSAPFKAYTRQFENLVRQWRPQLFGGAQ